MSRSYIERRLPEIAENSRGWRRPLRLPFNGTLSPDELRMLEQGTFDETGTDSAN